MSIRSSSVIFAIFAFFSQAAFGDEATNSTDVDCKVTKCPSSKCVHQCVPGGCDDYCALKIGTTSLEAAEPAGSEKTITLDIHISKTTPAIAAEIRKLLEGP